MTRTLLSIGGVAVSVFLITLLLSIYTGVAARFTAWVDHLDADLVVTTGGMDNAVVGVSRLSPRTLEVLGSRPGVARAIGILVKSGTLTLGGHAHGVLYIGYDPQSGAGAPWKLEAGSARIQPEEAVLDAALARAGGIGLGDIVEIGAARLRVAGLSADTHTGFYYVFFDRSQGAQVLGSGDAYTLALVWLQGDLDPTTVRRDLAANVPDVAVFSRSEFSRNTLGIFEEGALPPLRLIVAIGFLVGQAVIGLTVFTAVVERLQDYALIKALGGSAWRLTRLVVAESLLVSALGFLGGLALTLIGVLVLAQLTPRAAVGFEPVAVLLSLGLALLMAIAGSWLPVSRVLRTDPAIIFRT